MIRRALFGLFCAALAVSSHAQAQPDASVETRALYLIQYSAGPAWRAGAPMQDQALGPHVAYMRQLQAEGALFAAGPFLDAEGGMAIVLAGDDAAARAILEADPAIETGVFTAVLRSWRPAFQTEQPLPRAR